MISKKMVARGSLGEVFKVFVHMGAPFDAGNGCFGSGI